MVVSTAVRGFFVFLRHDWLMDKPVKADDRSAHGGLERIVIFRELAEEYAEFSELVGEVSEPEFGSDLSPQDRVALYLRLMLERKFVSTEDKNTYIPTVIEDLRVYLKDDDAVFMLNFLEWYFARVVSGVASRTSGSFNGVELNFESTRQMVTYGRLMHSDRNKFIRSRILKGLSHGLMIDQSRRIDIIIARLRSLIDSGVEAGVIPDKSETIEETWLDIHNRPALYEFGSVRVHEQREHECPFMGMPCDGAPFMCSVCPRLEEGDSIPDPAL